MTTGGANKKRHYAQVAPKLSYDVMLGMADEMPKKLMAREWFFIVAARRHCTAISTAVQAKKTARHFGSETHPYHKTRGVLTPIPTSAEVQPSLQVNKKKQRKSAREPFHLLQQTHEPSDYSSASRGGGGGGAYVGHGGTRRVIGCDKGGGGGMAGHCQKSMAVLERSLVVPPGLVTRLC